MAKQKIDQLTVSYDKDADVLYITEGKPREAIGEMMEDGIIVRRAIRKQKKLLVLRLWISQNIFLMTSHSVYHLQHIFRQLVAKA